MDPISKERKIKMKSILKVPAHDLEYTEAKARRS